jgi:hypothetical protein
VLARCSGLPRTIGPLARCERGQNCAACFQRADNPRPQRLARAAQGDSCPRMLQRLPTAVAPAPHRLVCSHYQGSCI